MRSSDRAEGRWRGSQTDVARGACADMWGGTVADGGGETVAKTVDDLFEGKRATKGAAERDAEVEVGHRQHRGHAEAAQAGDDVLPAEPDHEQADGRRRTGSKTSKKRRVAPGHFLGQGGEEQVIVTAGGNRGADENAVGEEGRGDFLEEQQGMAGFAGDNIDQGGEGEAGEANSAQDHPGVFQPAGASAGGRRRDTERARVRHWFDPNGSLFTSLTQIWRLRQTWRRFCPAYSECVLGSQSTYGGP